jgi:hypothetical protein
MRLALVGNPEYADPICFQPLRSMLDARSIISSAVFGKPQRVRRLSTHAVVA